MTERRINPAARAGVTAVVAATGLLGLASTGQTPSGFVPAAFGGPLGLFDGPAVDGMRDVLAIGDGAVDANELATLLKTTGPSAVPAGPVQAAITAMPGAADLAVLPPPIEPASAPTSKQSLDLKPVLDNNGEVDCSKAVSCLVDPATNTTTVTFSDGVVAVVQKINNLTLVAYKTLGDIVGGLLPKGITALPAAAVPPPVIAAAPAAGPAVDLTPAFTVAPKDSDAPSVSAGPLAPSPPAAPDITASDVRPTLTISTPPKDFDPKPGTGAGGGGVPTLPNIPAPDLPGALDAVKGAVGSVVGAVTDAVKSLGPGASNNPPKSDSPSKKRAE